MGNLGRIQRYCLSLFDTVIKDKAQMELSLARHVKDNKKGFCKYIDEKKTRENMQLLLNETGDLVTRDTRTQKRLRYCLLPLPQSLLARLAFWNTRSLRPGKKVGARKMYPWWKRIRARNT